MDVNGSDLILEEYKSSDTNHRIMANQSKENFREPLAEADYNE